MAVIKVYKNEDYTASRVKHDSGAVDYFIKYHSSTYPQEIKVDEREFLLYVGEFRKSLERQRNEKRRHIHNGDLEDIDENEMTLTHKTDFSKQFDDKVSLETVLKTCTPTQQERFTLYHDCGYSLEKIAEIQGVSFQAVHLSITAVSEKIKNIFFEP